MSSQLTSPPQADSPALTAAREALRAAAAAHEHAREELLRVYTAARRTTTP